MPVVLIPAANQRGKDRKSGDFRCWAAESGEPRAEKIPFRLLRLLRRRCTRHGGAGDEGRADTKRRVVNEDRGSGARQFFGSTFLRHPYTQPVICSAYVARFPSDESLGRIGLRPVAEAGNVFLYQAEAGDPVWQGMRKIRDHAGQSVDSLPVVSDAQIVVDLHRAGLRADEQVDALCKWEGFCRA